MSDYEILIVILTIIVTHLIAFGMLTVAIVTLCKSTKHKLSPTKVLLIIRHI